MTRYCHYQPYKLVSRDRAPLKKGERAGNALTFSHGPRDPKRFGREEK